MAIRYAKGLTPCSDGLLYLDKNNAAHCYKSSNRFILSPVSVPDKGTCTNIL